MKKLRFKKLANKILRNKPKRGLLKRDKATAVLPTKKAKPILRRSEVFKGEYEKEKALLGWK